MASLCGVLKRIRFTGERFWSVATLEAHDGRERTIVGNLLTVSPGDTLRLEGDWQLHARFGEQFRFRSFEVLAPATDEGVIGFLDSQLSNVGRVRATEMVRRFGRDHVFEIIERDPERLAEIPGLTQERALAIQTDYLAVKALRETLTLLKQFRLTDHRAAKVIERYGAQARDILQNDPYRLIEDIDGFGFKTVDEIAHRIGVDPQCLGRARAGCLHFLGVAEEKGNTFVPEAVFVRQVAQELGVPRERVCEALDALAAAGVITRAAGRVQSTRLRQAEEVVAGRLRLLAKGGSA